MKNSYFWNIAGNDEYKVAFVKAKQELKNDETVKRDLTFQTYYKGESVTFCGIEQ